MGEQEQAFLSRLGATTRRAPANQGLFMIRLCERERKEQRTISSAELDLNTGGKMSHCALCF